MPFQLLTTADMNEFNKAWKERHRAVFVKKVVDEWYSDMLDRIIERGLKDQLLETIKRATSLEDLWVSAGFCYDDEYHWEDGELSLSIKQLIDNTDALSRLATSIGPQIKIVPLYKNDMVFFQIMFCPNL